MERITRREAAGLLLTSGTLLAQQPTVGQLLEQARNAQPDGQVWVCPMDADVRSHNAGTCPRCGMTLKAGLPEQAEYHLELDVKPKPTRPGQMTELNFTVLDPWKHRPVTAFQVIHEKLFHMFLIGEDLQYFVHDHPVLDGGVFRYQATFPKAGMYRILGDFYPDGGTPQLIAKTLYVAGGAMTMAKLNVDLSAKQASNVEVAMRTIPEQPITGQTTQLHFDLKPGDGIEKYLGAWGHMLAASDDLIDLMHTHPFIADGGPHIQFNLVFARPRPYRIWVQFQRAGVVNTAHFDIIPAELR